MILDKPFPHSWASDFNLKNEENRGDQYFLKYRMYSQKVHKMILGGAWVDIFSFNSCIFILV